MKEKKTLLIIFTSMALNTTANTRKIEKPQLFLLRYAFEMAQTLIVFISDWILCGWKRLLLPIF